MIKIRRVIDELFHYVVIVLRKKQNQFCLILLTVNSGNVASRDDQIASAQCPNGMFVHTCTCQGGNYCDGPTISADGKTCNANAAHGGGSVRVSLFSNNIPLIGGGSTDRCAPCDRIITTLFY